MGINKKSYKILYIIAAILVILFISIIVFKLKIQEKCKGDCSIIKNCEENTNCMVSCGCECLSKDSECNFLTKFGACPIGGLACKCVNKTCEYVTP